MQDFSDIKLDKTQISNSDSFDNTEEKEYWFSRSPEERFEHIERLRRINYGNKTAERLQRILEVDKREWR